MGMKVSETIQRIGVVRISLLLAPLVLALLVAGVWDFLNAKYTDIDAERWNTCGVRTDGTVRCWGGSKQGAVHRDHCRWLALLRVAY